MSDREPQLVAGTPAGEMFSVETTRRHLRDLAGWFLVRRPRLDPIAGRLALFLSRFGRGGGRAGPPTGSQGRTAAANSVPLSQAAVDCNAADRLILQRRDLPLGFIASRGWETNSSDADGLEDNRQKFRSCLGIPPAEPVISRASDNFIKRRRSGLLLYHSEVDIYAEEADAAAELAALQRDDAGRRLAEHYVSRLPQPRGLTFTQPESTRLSPAVGTNQAYGWRVTVFAECNDVVGASISFTIDLLGFVKGKTVTRLDVVAIDREIKDKERDALFVGLVRRVDVGPLG